MQSNDFRKQLPFGSGNVRGIGNDKVPGLPFTRHEIQSVLMPEYYVLACPGCISLSECQRLLGNILSHHLEWPIGQVMLQGNGNAT